MDKYSFNQLRLQYVYETKNVTNTTNMYLCTYVSSKTNLPDDCGRPLGPDMCAVYSNNEPADPSLAPYPIINKSFTLKSYTF